MFQPQYTNFRGNYKKDLRVLAWGKKRYAERFASSLRNPPLLFPNPERDQRLLADVLIIEEDVSYIFPGQERNLLKTPTLSSYMFNNLLSWQSEELPPLTGNRMEDQNFMAINTLFYATGMLMHVIAQSRASGKGLADTAWEEQLRLGIIETGDESPVPGSRKWARYTPKMEFYLKGRDILRTYNPALNFAIRGQQA